MPYCDDDEDEDDNDEDEDEDEDNDEDDNDNDEGDRDDDSDEDEDNDDSDDDSDFQPAPHSRRRKRRRTDATTSTTTVIAPFRRPRHARRTKRQGFKPKEEVEVDYNGTWWRATIAYKHRGFYAVKYADEEGNVEKKVPFERIRSIED